MLTKLFSAVDSAERVVRLKVGREITQNLTQSSPLPRQHFSPPPQKSHRRIAFQFLRNESYSASFHDNLLDKHR